jgi:hypothetical protein
MNKIKIEENFRDSQLKIQEYESAQKAQKEIMSRSKLISNAGNVLSKDHQFNVEDWEVFCGDDFGSTSLKNLPK